MSIEVGQVSRAEIVIHIATLLSRFADAEHPALTEPKNAPWHVGKTGVLYQLDHMGLEHKILFRLFIRGRRGTPKEINSMVSMAFDIDDFHDEPEIYVIRLVAALSKRIVDRMEERAPPPKLEVVKS